MFIEHHIFEHCTQQPRQVQPQRFPDVRPRDFKQVSAIYISALESTCSEFDGIKDVRLFLFGQVDGLRVASSLDVGNAIVRPAVFIVADEQPIMVCG